MSKPRPDMPPFGEADVLDDPFELFAAWYERAAAEVPLAESVCVATVDGDGAPDARMVLLKDFDERGFRFFTNEQSVKGEQLGARPVAAMVFYWRELDRQVRIRGRVERLGPEESDEYFATRPRESRIGAWASPQSRPLDGRDELERRVAEAEERWPGEDVPRPPHWGGYRVVPDQIEFWQGQVGRLHDRFRYERDPGGPWTWTRLAP
ncbi:MAG: pyridoxamine 5'-phosphate oxidase [Solirubrobacterales bacterium]